MDPLKIFEDICPIENEDSPLPEGTLISKV